MRYFILIPTGDNLCSYDNREKWGRLKFREKFIDTPRITYMGRYGNSQNRRLGYFVELSDTDIIVCKLSGWEITDIPSSWDT